MHTPTPSRRDEQTAADVINYSTGAFERHRVVCKLSHLGTERTQPMWCIRSDFVDMRYLHSSCEICMQAERTQTTAMWYVRRLSGFVDMRMRTPPRNVLLMSATKFATLVKSIDKICVLSVPTYSLAQVTYVFDLMLCLEEQPFVHLSFMQNNLLHEV